MNKTRPEHEELIPVNCFWVGGSFLEYCVKQTWMVKQREGRSTRYFCTPAGVHALKQYGIEILRPAERKRKSPGAAKLRPKRRK
jgi:hypothetical protein